MKLSFSPVDLSRVSSKVKSRGDGLLTENVSWKQKIMIKIHDLISCHCKLPPLSSILLLSAAALRWSARAKTSCSFFCCSIFRCPVRCWYQPGSCSCSPAWQIKLNINVGNNDWRTCKNFFENYIFINVAIVCIKGSRVILKSCWIFIDPILVIILVLIVSIGLNKDNIFNCSIIQLVKYVPWWMWKCWKNRPR